LGDFPSSNIQYKLQICEVDTAKVNDSKKKKKEEEKKNPKNLK